MNNHQEKGKKESASARAWSDNSISKRKFLAFLSHSKRKTMGKARLPSTRVRSCVSSTFKRCTPIYGSFRLLLKISQIFQIF